MRMPHQITLSTLLLMVTIVAIGISWYRTRNQIQNLEASIESMESLTRDLRINDRSKIAVITKLPTLVGELVHDVYLPKPVSTADSAGQQLADHQPYQLCLALDQITNNTITTQAPVQAADKSFGIDPGRHTIELRYQENRQADPKEKFEIDVVVDGEIVIHAVRPATWNSSRGWSGSGTISKTKSFTIGQEVELHRRRFHEPLPNGGSKSPPPEKATNGIVLWIRSATDNPK